MSQASRPSLHEEILSKLRDFIVEGHIAAGARVPERELCQDLGVSRTPLREALKVLAAEGLVELLPNRGARVKRLAESDVRNLFEVLAGLELVAGKLACVRMSDADLEELQAVHYAMYAHYMKRELPEYFKLNQKIHNRIVAAADNPMLSALYGNLDSRLRRMRYSANVTKRDRWGEAMREHEAILDALIRRSEQEVGELMYAHIMHKCEAACALVYSDSREIAAAPEMQASAAGGEAVENFGGG